MKKKDNNLKIIYGAMHAVGLVIGILGGFLYSYKTMVENYAKDSSMIEDTRTYQQLLRKQIDALRNKKMEKNKIFCRDCSRCDRIQAINQGISGL